MFIQSIDVAVASFYRDQHHKLYVQLIKDKGKLTVAQMRNTFMELCYSGYMAAAKRVNVPNLFKDLGHLNPVDGKLRVPFQFVPPVEVVQPATAPKPKPRAAPKQLPMAAFLKKNQTTRWINCICLSSNFTFLNLSFEGC